MTLVHMPVTKCIPSPLIYFITGYNGTGTVNVWCWTLVILLPPRPLTDIRKLLIQYESNILNLVNKANFVHNFLTPFIPFLYTFRATMCPSSGEKLYLCDTWYLSLCVDDCLVCMAEFIPPCIPDSHPHRVTNIKCRIYRVISPDDGHIVVRNM
jgi:hypothetical protein